ncbi:hypothetical protein D3C81_1165260 [compost metagenome]
MIIQQEYTEDRHQQRCRTTHDRVGLAHVGDVVDPRDEGEVHHLQDDGCGEERPAVASRLVQEREDRRRQGGCSTGDEYRAQQLVATAFDDGVPGCMQQRRE